jgi:hypothetical protein
VTGGTWPNLTWLASLYVAICIGLIFTTDSLPLQVALGLSLAAAAAAVLAARFASDAALRAILWTVVVGGAVSLAAMLALWHQLGGSALDSAPYSGYYRLSHDKGHTPVSGRVYYAVAAAETAVLMLVPAFVVLGGSSSGPRSSTKPDSAVGGVDQSRP